jgi:hypothetical protein
MKVDYEGNLYIKVGRKYLKTDIDTTYIEKLQKQIKDLEKEKADFDRALITTQNRYFPLEIRYLEANLILEDVLNWFVKPLTRYSFTDADKEHLERAEKFLKGEKIVASYAKELKVQWHDLRKNPKDLPSTDDDKLYLVYVYSNSPEKFRFGEYTPVVCLWNYDFCRFDILESTIGDSAVNTKNILKWRELESC